MQACKQDGSAWLKPTVQSVGKIRTSNYDNDVGRVGSIAGTDNTKLRVTLITHGGCSGEEMYGLIGLRCPSTNLGATK